jgi:hypothetical protein
MCALEDPVAACKLQGSKQNILNHDSPFIFGTSIFEINLYVVVRDDR